MLTREVIIAKRLCYAFANSPSCLVQLHMLKLICNSPGFLLGLSKVFLGMNGLEHSSHLFHPATRHNREDVSVKVNRTPLPPGIREVFAQRFNKSKAFIRYYPPNAFNPRFLPERKKLLQPSLSSLPPSTMPRMSRKPSIPTPMATRTETFRTSPPQLRLRHMPSK